MAGPRIRRRRRLTTIFTSRAVVAADRDTGRAIPAVHLCTRNCARPIAYLVHTDNG
jgi:hypothetical protein